MYHRTTCMSKVPYLTKHPTFENPHLQMYLKSKNGEDDYPSKDGRSTVNTRHKNGVSVTIVVHRVVTRHGNKPTEGKTQREEDLCGCLKPNLGINKLVKLQDTSKS